MSAWKVAATVNRGLLKKRQKKMTSSHLNRPAAIPSLSLCAKICPPRIPQFYVGSRVSIVSLVNLANFSSVHFQSGCKFISRRSEIVNVFTKLTPYRAVWLLRVARSVLNSWILKIPFPVIVSCFATRSSICVEPWQKLLCLEEIHTLGSLRFPVFPADIIIINLLC